MRNRIILAIAACMLLCAAPILVACSTAEDINFAGTWILVEFDMGNGTVYTDEDFADLGTSGADVLTINLNYDGTVTMTSTGSNPIEGTSLTWAPSEEQDAVIISSDDTDTYSLSYDESAQTLQLEYQGQAITLARA